MIKSIIRSIDKIFFPNMDNIGLFTYTFTLLSLLFFVAPVAIKEDLTPFKYSTTHGNFTIKSSFNGIRGSGHTLFIYKDDKLIFQSSCLGVKDRLCNISQQTILNNHSIFFVSYLENKDGVIGKTFGSIIEIRNQYGDVILKNNRENIVNSFQGTRNSYYYLKFSVFVMGCLAFIFLVKILNRRLN